MPDPNPPLPVLTRDFGILIPPKPSPRTLYLENFVDKPTIAKTVASAPPAQWARGVGTQSFWPAYYNHKLGTCWPAAIGHWIQVMTWNNGRYTIPPDKYIMQAYIGAGGRNPATGQGTDGVYSINMLRWWMDNGFGGDKHYIDSFMALDGFAHDTNMLKWAIYSFGVVFAAVLLPKSSIDQYNAGPGNPFTVVSGPDGDPQWGHMIPIFGYHDKMFGGSTWGVSKEMTEDWLWKYQAELWVVKSKEWKQLAGFDVAGFEAAKYAVTI